MAFSFADPQRPEQGRQLMATLLQDLHLDDLDLIAAAPIADQDLWRREFEYAGYGAVKRIVSGANGWDEPRLQCAIQWLAEKENEVAHRERQMQLDAARIE